MLKVSIGLVLVFAMGAKAGVAAVAMPEPGGLPELLICLAGIGYVALRRRGVRR